MGGVFERGGCVAVSPRFLLLVSKHHMGLDNSAVGQKVGESNESRHCYQTRVGSVACLVRACLNVCLVLVLRCCWRRCLVVVVVVV